MLDVLMLRNMMVNEHYVTGGMHVGGIDMKTKKQIKIDEYEEYNKNCELIIESRQMDIDEAIDMVAEHNAVIAVLTELIDVDVYYRCSKHIECDDYIKCDHKIKHTHTPFCGSDGCREFKHGTCVIMEE